MTPGPIHLRPTLAAGSAIKLIGLGGVGGIVARYLAVFLVAMRARARARLVLIDGDRFEARNAERMQFSREGNKAEVVRDDLGPLVDGSYVGLVAIGEYVAPDNVARLIGEGDHVLLAVDNHRTRKLIDDHAGTLDDLLLISGGNDGVGTDATGHPLRGTYGNVQVYLRQGGRDSSPPLSFCHPEIERPRDRLPTEISCGELLEHVPQVLFTNLLTASAMLNAWWLHLCAAEHYHEICFDIHDGLMSPLPPVAKSTG